MRFLLFLNEDLSKQDVATLEEVLNRLYNKVGLDLVLGQHFFDRANDSRNRPPITFKETKDMLTKAFHRYGEELSKSNIGRNIQLSERSTDINFIMIFDRSPKEGMKVMEAKTIMRKKNFGSAHKKFYL